MTTAPPVRPSNGSATIAAPPAMAGASAPAGSFSVTPTRPTWRDWVGPDAPAPAEMLTRDELVDRLRADGIDVTSDAIALWQRRGLLPYPTKRREGTATVGYYPGWVADLVRELRHLQASGMKLAEIVPHLRELAHRLAPRDAVISVPVATATGAAHAPEVGARTVRATVGVAAAPDSFVPLAEAIALVYQGHYGTSIAKVEIRLTDDRGNPVSFTFNT